MTRLTRREWEMLGELMLPFKLGGRRQLPPTTAEKLIKLGYVEAKEHVFGGRFPVTVIEHQQTLLGNVCFCEWAEKPDRKSRSALAALDQAEGETS